MHGQQNVEYDTYNLEAVVVVMFFCVRVSDTFFKKSVFFKK